MKLNRSMSMGALLCALAGTTLAQSQQRPFYLGVDLGQAEINRNWRDVDTGNSADFAWKLRFGYRFTAHVSLEAAFTDFGDYDGRFAFSILPGVIGTADYTTSATGIDVSLVGSWPVGEVVYIKAAGGLARREFKTHYAPVFTGAPPTRGADGDLAIQYGLGVGFRINESLDLSLDWVTTGNLEGDMEFRPNDSDPALLSLGLRFKL